MVNLVFASCLGNYRNRTNQSAKSVKSCKSLEISWKRKPGRDYHLFPPSHHFLKTKVLFSWARLLSASSFLGDGLPCNWSKQEQLQLSPFEVGSKLPDSSRHKCYFYTFHYYFICLPTQLFDAGWMGLRDNLLYFTRKLLMLSCFQEWKKKDLKGSIKKCT